ncbi:MAG TPA: hypothetical protein VOA41_01295 [Candidatus Dormibacteraeota bacterium]|nr:hypothetical protein [Candidatus Dormibacteraeota bacterium]
MIRVTAEVIGLHTYLSRDPTTGSQSIDVNIDTNWTESGAACSDSPTPPTTANINQQPSLTTPKGPFWDRIPAQPPS